MWWWMVSGSYLLMKVSEVEWDSLIFSCVVDIYHFQSKLLVKYCCSGRTPSDIYLELEAGQTVGIENIWEGGFYGTGSGSLYSYFSGKLIKPL